MKRAAAILGSTPSFVRWAIRHPCSLRQLTDKDLPNQSFRQLRSIRELSIAKIENRIINDICIHPENYHSGDTIRGFPIAEITSLYESFESLEKNCKECPANAVGHESEGQVLAGCYGWLLSRDQDIDWITQFETKTIEAPLSSDELPQGTRNWFQIWQRRSWYGQYANRLYEFLKSISMGSKTPTAMLDLIRAAEQCSQHQMTLETELIPAGFSDGLTWRIESHCSNCRCEAGMGKSCPECGSRQIHPETKKKVLGLRPYMLLKSILGPKHADELATRAVASFGLKDQAQ
ncbi:MAG: hypothetical protein AAGA30_03265 [Planctomycetota bacterium]